MSIESWEKYKWLDSHSLEQHLYARIIVVLVNLDLLFITSEDACKLNKYHVVLYTEEFGSRFVT